jgi:iron complex transport system substrate-binding protein
MDLVPQAEELAAQMSGRVQSLRARLAQVEEGPRVFHDIGDLWTPGPDTFQGELYRLLKAQNIAQDVQGWAQLSAETLVDRDPQVIITTVKGGPQAIRENPAFQRTSAVKDGRVYSIDADLVDIAGPRIVQGLEALAKFLYPQLFD